MHCFYAFLIFIRTKEDMLESECTFLEVLLAIVIPLQFSTCSLLKQKVDFN